MHQEVGKNAAEVESKTDRRQSDTGDESRNRIKHNNQTTVFMCYPYKDNEHIILMHETRLFYFKMSATTKKGDIQECMLDLLTTRKYRLLQILYIIFRLTDNIMFIALIISTVLHTDISELETSIILIFIVIGIELFYDLLNYTTKIWILCRLNIYLAVLFYISYATVFALVAVPKIVWILYGIRLGAFIAEEMMDFALDLEMHNDLLKITPKPFCSFLEFNLDTEELKAIRNCYIGSMCIWMPVGAFKYPENNKHLTSDFIHLHRIIITLVGIPIYIISIVYIIMLFAFKKCSKCCNADCDNNEWTYV